MIKPATGARRRILVGLDASPASLAALDAALRLAVELDAEIDALYVEDANMLRFAGLPFTRIIDAWSAGPREVEPPDVERALRLQAQRVRRHLADAAGTRITWNFRVARGDVEGEIMAAARDADLLTLGFVGDRPVGGRGAGSLARRAAREAPGSVLLAQRAQIDEGPVVLWLDGGPQGDQALTTAASLARTHGGRLTVICFGNALDEHAQDLESDVANRLSDLGITSRFTWVPSEARRALPAVLREAHGGTLVVSTASDLAESDILDTLIEESACSLLFVR
ncbi:MAG: universal stress protein [Alphaproteobacteria bacterium]